MEGPARPEQSGPVQPPDFDPCGTGLFHCGKSYCIPESRVCDRVQDCPGNNPLDERACYELCKPPGYFPCGDSHCILGEQRCNGVVDCKTGADEGLLNGCHSTFFRDLVIGVSVIFVVVFLVFTMYVVYKRRRNRHRLVNRAPVKKAVLFDDATFKKVPPVDCFHDDGTVTTADDALLLDETKRKTKT